MVNLKDGNGDLEQFSAVERFKANSDGLYGPIPDDLAAPVDHFQDESVQLLKHHGTYQQDNRDLRKERKKEGLGKLYTMMVRTKFPGGRLSSEQYLICDGISDRYGQKDMRATSRQDFQFHGVVKGSLRPLLADLNRLAGISTLGGCGDVVRNTMANPIADIDPAYAKCGIDLMALAGRISEETMPATKAYFDLWLNDEKAVVNPDGTVVYAKDLKRATEEPLYGKQYLPRKFKVGICTDFDNAADVYTQDFGIIAVTKDGAVTGYEILTGGGLGYTHSMEKTYPRAATPLAFVQEEDILPLLMAVVAVQRDYGDRKDRKQARLKYTIDRMGEDAFREKVYEYAGRKFDPPCGVQPSDQCYYLGWHKQSQEGLNYVGVWIENGRIKDFDGGPRFKSALRTIAERFKPDMRITPHHNMVLANIADADVDAVQALLDEHGIPTGEALPPLRAYEMACPALPLCGLALSEAERALPDVMRKIMAAGHAGAEVSIRMTGCPNGCARSSSSEIGIIGSGKDRFVLHTGGCHIGTRLNELFAVNLKEVDLAPAIAQLLDLWKAQRDGGERFGDWSKRVGVKELRELAGYASDGKRT